MTDAPRIGPPWYAVGAGDLLMLVLALALVQTAPRGLIGDPGLGWHLMTPEVIVSTGTWPTADPFTGPSRGHYWLANQWLGDVPFWLGWKAAGMAGVAAVTVALLVFIYRLVYRFLRADGLAWPAAFAWALLAAQISSYLWTARPNLFTLLGVAVLARVLTLFHEGRLPPRRLLWVPVMFAVWANMHGGFVVGLAMLAVAGGVEGALGLFHPDPAARAGARKRCGVLIAVAAGAVIGTLANPYGWKVYPWIASLLGDDYFMNLNVEWLSPDFHEPRSGFILAAIVSFPALFAVSRHRPNLVLLALSLVWLFLALKGRRYLPLWVVVSIPLMARTAAEIDWLNARLARLWEARPDYRELLDLLRDGGWIGTVVLAAGLIGWAALSPPLQHDEEYRPVKGLQTLLAARQPGEVVFHGPNDGGYLILHGGPEFGVWIDDRNEIHGREWYETYFDIVRTVPDWEKKLAEWNVRWVAIDPNTPLAFRLSERPEEWEAVFRDKQIAVFHKRSEPKP